MKTIRQIAEEIGVSKQAIRKKMKQEPLITSLRGLMVTNGNQLAISVEGERLIKSEFEEKTTTNKLPIDNQNDNQFYGKYIKLLEKNNFDLCEELNVKDKQIEALIDIIDTLSSNKNQWTNSQGKYTQNKVRIPLERLAKHQLKSRIQSERERQAMAREASKRMKDFPIAIV